MLVTFEVSQWLMLPLKFVSPEKRLLISVAFVVTILAVLLAAIFELSTIKYDVPLKGYD